MGRTVAPPGLGASRGFRGGGPALPGIGAHNGTGEGATEDTAASGGGGGADGDVDGVRRQLAMGSPPEDTLPVDGDGSVAMDTAADALLSLAGLA